MARDYRGAEVGGSLAGSASGASLGESSGPKHSLAAHVALYSLLFIYDSIATVGEIRVYWRADFQSGSRVLKKVF